MTHTLLVPTYNRPRELARLLRFLAGGPDGAAPPLPARVLVGDSSRAEHRARNRAAVEAVAGRLEIRWLDFPETMPAFVKYGALAAAAEGDTVSFCADDDLPVPEALQAAAAELAAAPAECIAVQGRSFYLAERGEGLLLEAAAYWRDDLAAADRWARVEALFAAYEAPFYAVYRRQALQAAFAGMPAAADPLWQELWLALASVAAGQIRRRPDWGYGRFVVDLPGFSDWHPHEIMARAPMRLVEGMRDFRDRALPLLAGGEGGTDGPDAAAAAARLDLLLLRYLGGFLVSGAVDDLIAARREGRGPEALAAVWRKWARGEGRARGRHRRDWRPGAMARHRRRAAGIGRRILRRLARDPAMAVETDERLALPRAGTTLLLGQEFLLPSGTGAPEPTDAEVRALAAVIDRYWACDRPDGVAASRQAT